MRSGNINWQMFSPQMDKSNSAGEAVEMGTCWNWWWTGVEGRVGGDGSGIRITAGGQAYLSRAEGAGRSSGSSESGSMRASFSRIDRSTMGGLPGGRGFLSGFEDICRAEFWVLGPKAKNWARRSLAGVFVRPAYKSKNKSRRRNDKNSNGFRYRNTR